MRGISTPEPPYATPPEPVDKTCRTPIPCAGGVLHLFYVKRLYVSPLPPPVAWQSASEPQAGGTQSLDAELRLLRRLKVFHVTHSLVRILHNVGERERFVKQRRVPYAGGFVDDQRSALCVVLGQLQRTS
ncbi:MAG: hypothetical protein L0170_09465 [Acidobacteria bacterium]|nr:hypothetical protein [Acidobacteriota bacterium]